MPWNHDRGAVARDVLGMPIRPLLAILALLEVS
jgi:hypothetical protein